MFGWGGGGGFSSTIFLPPPPQCWCLVCICGAVSDNRHEKHKVSSKFHFKDSLAEFTPRADLIILLFLISLAQVWGLVDRYDGLDGCD